MMLEVQDLRVAYGKIEALKGISFTVNEGEIVTLVGANGAGKTTTMRTISGLRNVVGGSITFEGKDITQMPSHERVKLGICQSPEGRGIFPGMTVRENLDMGTYTRKDHKSSAKDADFARVLELFPRLEERITQLGGTLSGGEQQMLAIGRALMSRPRLLLCDEPSLGLAPLITQELFTVLKSLNQQDGLSVLLVEQNANLALKVASKVYLLETGQVVASGTAEAIAGDERIRKAYLGG